MDALPTNRSWQPSCSHGTYQHEAIISRSRQLLMMGTRLPETCWATSRREIKNTKNDIYLVFLIPTELRRTASHTSDSLPAVTVHQTSSSHYHYSAKFRHDVRKMSASCTFPRFRSCVLLVKSACRWRWVWSVGSMTLQGKVYPLQENQPPVPLCPLHVLHELTRDQTRVSDLTRRQLTAWGMDQSWRRKLTH